MQIVDYNAIVQNAKFFKSIAPTAKLCAVLKNDAYGHGIVRTASCLSGIADCFAVGTVSEAMKVAPFISDVLILLPLFGEDVSIAVNHNFILTVDSFATFDALLQNLPRGQTARVHIKIDSGMNRLGFRYDELPKLVEMLLYSANKICVEGVFSHFYGESESDCDKQVLKFIKASDFLESALKTSFVRHIANTNATLLSNKYHFDMVRVGLGLYGYGCDSVIPAKTVFANVVAVKNVYAGEIVGYGAEYTFPRDSKIAIVHAGYANGFVRALKGAHVLVGDVVCPVVGNICMAMFAVEVSNVTKDVCVGDSVVLLGKGINNANSNVIVYELLCNLD